MKITKSSALFFVLSMCVPLFSFAAPALDSIPDAVKSRYEFNGSITSAVSDGTTLYVGGNFTDITPINGEPLSTTRNYLAAFDVSDGSLIEAFDPNLNSGVTSLALSPDGSTLYMGGSFWCVGGEFEAACLESERFNLAAIDTTTGDATAFDPSPDGEVNTIALSDEGTPLDDSDDVLFAGGSFTDVNNGTTRNYIAAFTVVDGVATNFDPNVDNTVWSIVLSSDESTAYAAGDFTTVNGGVPQEYIAAFDSGTGDVTNFNAALDSTGQALALSSDDATLYVGGNVTQFTTRSGQGVPFNETTQVPVAVYPRISTSGGGGTVSVSIPDGAGGWYIGGSFTNVGTTTQPRLAHITSSGVFDGAFNPDIDNGAVFDLELFGTTLYAGGQFNSVDNGTTRNYVAAFNAATGATTPFDPDAGGTVHALALSSDGGTLYIGGEFGTFDGGTTFRNYVGAFTTVGAGTVTVFDPDADNYVRTLALSDDDGTLYLGGDFTSFDGGTTLRNYAGAFTTAGAGTAVAGFNPNANAVINTLILSPDETSIYAGGSFSTIGGGSRTALAKLNTSDGTLVSAFDAAVTGNGQQVYTVALSTDEATLYVGGDFTDIGGEARTNFGELNVTTGAATNFDPQFGGVVRSVSVASLEGEVYVGGEFTGYGTVSAPYLLGIDLSDYSLITAFAPIPDNAVYKIALSSDDELLYAGGDFVDVNSGTSRDYLAAFDTTDGTATAFDPVGTSFVYGLGLADDDTELYVGNYDINSGTSTLFFFNAGGVVADETPPVITLLGVTPVNLTVGDAYADAGATALDDVDGDITADIVTVNPVNTAVAGVYTVTYNVSDAALNAAIEVTRTVNVSAAGGDDDDDDDGGGSGSRRTDNLSQSRPIILILTRLISVLTELIALMTAQQVAQ